MIGWEEGEEGEQKIDEDILGRNRREEGRDEEEQNRKWMRGRGEEYWEEEEGREGEREEEKIRSEEYSI